MEAVESVEAELDKPPLAPCIMRSSQELTCSNTDDDETFCFSTGDESSQHNDYPPSLKRKKSKHVRFDSKPCGVEFTCQSNSTSLEHVFSTTRQSLPTSMTGRV